MARPALIEKLMQPAKWLFKKELIPVEDLAGNALKSTGGKLNVDFNEMPPDAMKALFSAMVQQGGGLSIDPVTGKLRFDSTGMDLSVVEALMKKLRLPIWLAGPTNFYVDKSHVNTADTLDKDRGLSAEKPFKTIQACANYIADNFNLGTYNATILVNSGIYEENLVLPEYTTSSGSITITRYNNVNRNDVTIKNIQSGSTILLKGSKWTIKGIHINHVENLSNITSRVYRYPITLTIGELILHSCKIDIGVTGSLGSGGVLQYYPIQVSDSGKITIEPNDSENMELNLPASAISGLNVYCLNAGNGGFLNFPNGPADTNGEFKVSGAFTCFARVSNGNMSFGSGRPVPIQFVNGAPAPSGKRYECSNGGTIATGGSGPDFFPGNTAGTVDADTYSWYK